MADPVPAKLAERLYTLPPDEFMATRNAAVAEAKEAGDVDRAKAIGKLRKPSIAAWLVNLLAIRRPELLGELAELSDALRSAQRNLRGDEMRELSTQRRSLIGVLVNEARTLGVAANPALGKGKLPLADVEETLTAALADPEAATLVSSGRLVRTIEYSGIGEVPRPQLRLVTDVPPEVSSVDRAAKKAPVRDTAAEKRAVQKELAAARTDEKKTRTDLARADQAEQDAARALADLDTALADLQRRRAAAEDQLGRQKVARKTAERAVAAAVRRVGAAEAALADLDSFDRKGRRTG